MSTILLIVACSSSGQTYKKKQCIDGSSWTYDSALLFEEYRHIENEESIIRIYHEQTYGYENLYIKAIITTVSDTLSEKVYSIPLMNQYGEWLGKSSGGLMHTDYSFDPQISKRSGPVGQKTNLLITQHSREEHLKGIACIEVITQGKRSL